ncbi:pseudouridine synthase [Dechloromonas sp. ZY10]|uniref:pseudouridine synthase n=1 Tax=Dechloromonas aquae TaxID=2664436 RepID=UPI003528E8CA
MSGKRRDSQAPQDDAVTPGNDPWARWREPVAEAAESLPAAPAAAVPGPEGDGERAPLGTLSVRRSAAAVATRKTSSKGGKLAQDRARVNSEAPRRKEGERQPGKPARTQERSSQQVGKFGEKPAFRKSESPAARRAPSSAGDDPWGKSRRSSEKKAGFAASTVSAAATAPVVIDPARPAPAGVRLSKVMSERGLCSRREADLWIERGWVLVNGEVVSELGSRIDPQATITISQEARKDQAKAVTILLHKPVGYVSGQPEPGSVPAVTLITPENQLPNSGGPEFKPWMLRGLAPAGRLDVDSTGLLVLTSDGRVAKRLIGEDSDAEKEYLVRVSGRMIDGGLALLRHGLELDGKPLRQAWVKQLNEDQLHFILKEGKKRQIRRMCELVGLKVIGLKRVRIGRIRLGDLPLGQWRFLREGESF